MAANPRSSLRDWQPPPAYNVAATLLALAAAVGLAYLAFLYYAYTPWTRDGRVRVYTVQVAPEVSGTVVAVRVRDNQFVRKGDVLFEIDPQPFQIALDQAKAKKEQDTANLGNAKADLVRYTGLGAYASRQQTETQTALVAQLTAQVASDQAAIDNATTQLGYATIRAPMSEAWPGGKPTTIWTGRSG